MRCLLVPPAPALLPTKHSASPSSTPPSASCPPLCLPTKGFGCPPSSPCHPATVLYPAMPHRLSVPLSFLPLIGDEEESPTEATPRTSFLLFLDPPESQHANHIRRRPYSLFSVDSGYFSMMGKESPIAKSFSRRPSAAELRPPLAPINGTTDATYGSPRRGGVIRSLLRKTKKSMSAPCPLDLDPFPLGVSHRVPEDDLIPQQTQTRSLSLSPPRSRPRDPSVDAFELQDRFVMRQGMKHHPYPRDDAPYMLAYDRTLLDKYVSLL